MDQRDTDRAYGYSWSGEGGAGCVQIHIERLGLPVDLVRRAAGNLRSSSLCGLVIDHVAHLSRDAARHCADPAAPALGIATIELARALLASAAYTDRYSRDVLAETLLTRIRAYVRQRLTDPELRPVTIAAAHNISLRHLYKICAQADFSLEQWIIEERLRGAREELARPESHRRSIAMISRRWGFRDPTHFARRFGTAYGLTPGQWRRVSREPD